MTREEYMAAIRRRSEIRQEMETLSRPWPARTAT